MENGEYCFIVKTERRFSYFAIFFIIGYPTEKKEDILQTI